MNIQFFVHIDNKGETNSYILEMIGNHNGKHIKLDLDFIIAHLEAYKAHKPNFAIGYSFDEQNRQLDIWEGNEHNFTLHIEEREIYELVNDKVFDVHELLNPILEQYALDNNLKPKNN